MEDNPADVRLTQEALRDARVANHLTVVGDGRKALDCLRRKPGFEDWPTPDLILLDLNLPIMDGREVLAELKADPELRKTPVIVLTTSQREQDVAMSYDLHANSYITKPVDFDQFIHAVRVIEEFWMSIVRLPNRTG